MPRKIPVTMATQHPDNACQALFCDDRFVSAREEIEECYHCFSDLGVHEYMWDWEGKFVDEAVIDRLYAQYYQYFRENPLGKEKFLTFRVPNIWEEKSHKLPRAFMNLIAAGQAAKNYKLYDKPLFEVILPMATKVDQLKYLQEKFHQISKAAEDIFEHTSPLKHVEVIPLFEEVETMADSTKILEEYVDFLDSEYDIQPEYLRVFIARSDPAMNAGLIPTMLAVKHALSAYHEFGKKRGIKIYPWIGGGSLPFRGGINPHNVQPTLDEYKGVASLTIQTAFRSDYPLDEVQKAVDTFNREIPKGIDQYRVITDEEGERIKTMNVSAKAIFGKRLKGIADIVNKVADALPSHRERMQHIGLFGYARGDGELKLPRAIKFTGALYSIGVPPELIATGQVLKDAQDSGDLDLVKELYVNLVRDLEHAGHYLNRENLEILAKDNPVFADISRDIDLIESILSIKLGPVLTHHMLHRNYTSNVLQRFLDSQDITADVLHSAEIRRSLG